ncbi:hypothetical protein CDO73_06940 [Saccharibacillus sp. O23]|uniref:SMI1/KNR4 family protein n=1 Tax=Saccharibacillus sp. O23 TaxID=2009338 RepID=UPI000B4E00D1|nr:SMI1/KNR4 family protein [Saccharibacillus sp. O23]OWR31457.1 hypothetical protein CDO73_06940 [Saccharibacillus sp. O23]
MKKQVQLDRIVWKLKMAARRDEALKEFGAARHGYRMNETLDATQIASFEAAAGVTLPEEFSEFLQVVGNGGAGPYYGVTPLKLGERADRLRADCLLSPDMSQARWNELTAFLEETALSRAEKEQRLNELYGGLLEIGAMGWTFEMRLVLTGRHRGRIVYIDRTHQIPYFTYEANFLEWYERWLDEIIGGYDTGWFAMERSEGDRGMVDFYLSSLEEKVKVSAIQGMHKLKKLKPETIDFLSEQCEERSAAVRIAALEVLSQKEYAAAIPFLARALDSKLAEERLNAVRQIGIRSDAELAALLERRLPECGTHARELLERNARDENAEIREETQRLLSKFRVKVNKS